MIRFNCQQCGKKFKAPVELAGRVVSCSKCGEKVVVPLPLPEELAEELAGKPEPKKEETDFSFEKSKHTEFGDLIDMTAMVDIVFFLLIFFMVTSMEGLYSTIGIPAPSAEKSSSNVKRTVTDIEKDTDYALVRIDRDDTMWIENDKISTEHELRIKLRAAKQGDKDHPAVKKMMILGNGDCHTVTVIKAIDAGNDVGMDEVQLAVDDNE